MKVSLEAFKNLPEEKKEEFKKKLLFRQLNSKEELRAWVYIFFGILFPMGTVYPTSTHGPVEAMWRIYELIKTGESKNVPQVTMLSSRDSFKTLSASTIEVLAMVHFNMSLVHMAAIKQQSKKSVEYVKSHFRKIDPYLKEFGWKKDSETKEEISYINDKKEKIFLKTIAATVEATNGEHTALLVVDEIDLIQDPKALEEAKMIPSVFGKYFPLTVYLSTRKWKGGLMEKTLKETVKIGGEILRWNIVDVTERITHKEAKVKKPKVTRYISRNLPLQNLSVEEWQELSDDKKNHYERFEAYAGIADHIFLPVMKNMLVDRPQDDYGHLYKPLISVKNNFLQTSNEMAEAQLLCNQPMSSNLVYPRFDEAKNVISVEEAIKKITADEKPPSVKFEYLKQYIKDLGVPIIGGADWGFSDHTSLIILAVLPSGEIWLLDMISEPKLELDDIVKYMTELQQTWNVDKWYVDQAYPAYIKTLRRKGFVVPKFTKVVEDGIAAIQSKIVDSKNVRKFFIIDTPQNKPAIDAFTEYKWKLDSKGDIIEGRPYHDKEGISDIMDAIRYPFQNLFTRGGKLVFTSGIDKEKDLKKIIATSNIKEASKAINKSIMKDKIKSLATNNEPDMPKKSKKRIFWS